MPCYWAPKELATAVSNISLGSIGNRMDLRAIKE